MQLFYGGDFPLYIIRISIKHKCKCIFIHQPPNQYIKSNKKTKQIVYYIEEVIVYHVKVVLLLIIKVIMSESVNSFMKKEFFRLIAFCALLFATSCSTGEYDNAIKDACKEANCNAYDIEFVDSIDNNIIKRKVQQYIASIDSAIISIGDSALVEFLCPKASTIKKNLIMISNLSDYAYLRFRVEATRDSRNITKYALVSYREDLMYPIKIVDEDYLPEMDYQLKKSETSVKSLLNNLNLLKSKTPEERLQMKVEKEKHIEEQRIAKLKKLEEQKKIEEERRYAPKSWEDVAQWMKKKGCSVVGIFKSNSRYGGTLCIYKRGGGTYLSVCSICNKPIDFQFADKLRKVGSNAYQHNEPGSDMPERFIISSGELISYCYNPDMGEWVYMDSYYQVY